MAVALEKPEESAEGTPNPKGISPVSRELVIGLVGFAGSGCSTVAKKLRAVLNSAGYEDEDIFHIKLSSLIERKFPDVDIPKAQEGAKEGVSKLARAQKLQDLGDSLREKHGDHAVASLTAQEIIDLRGKKEHGTGKLAFILDSIKHYDEVDLLRRVYDKSFRLIAVHCDRSKRESRVIGKQTSDAKYKGADDKAVTHYLNRDEKDSKNTHGQQVRDAFYHADYFLDNNVKTVDGLRIVGDLERFVDLLLGKNLVRPRKCETGMFYAQAAALRSSCLSRQVGAALESADGRLVASGANEVPRFNGGVYSEDDKDEGRCFEWKWKGDDGIVFSGCHNTRLKKKLRADIANWLAETFSDAISGLAFPRTTEGFDAAAKARSDASKRIFDYFKSIPDKFDKMPGVKDIIEYSRSIHAEMNALFNAATQGISPVDSTLYTTTFPCHNCARHLVTAGVKTVYYIEPFTKSLATELHSASIATEVTEKPLPKMLVLPFTGVGPRMFEEYFSKRTDLKDDKTGEYKNPEGDVPSYAVRLRELAHVEMAAAKLIED